MKLLPLAITMASLTILPAHAEELTEADRAKLAEKLDQLLKRSQDTLTKRQATAYKAYKAALRSDSAALDLYLNCIERSQFEDQGKSSSDFREWRRRQKDRYSDPSFKIALRHQLNWLVLTIEAARAENNDYDALAPKARTALQNIFNDAEKLKGSQGILNQNVFSSVFARAYGFGNINVKDWPTSPLAIAEIYEQLVFPQLRAGEEADKLRSAWQERINYQAQALEEWAHSPDSKRVGMKKDQLPPAYEKFLAETKPNLVWQMEMDVFKAGNESEAAVRMLDHISENIAHNNASKWAEELTNLISPPRTSPSPYLEEEF